MTMKLRTTLLSALGASLGASLLAVPAAHAQIYQGQTYVVPSSIAGATDDEETGTIPQELPAGSVPGYRDPYAATSPRGDYVQSTPMAPPPGAVQAPTYSSPGYGAQGQAAPGQPIAIAPGALPAPNAQQIPQQGYQQAPAGYVQPGYAQQPQPQQQYGATGGYQGSYNQDAMLQAARTGAQPAPQAGYAQPQPGQVSYTPGTMRDAGPAPSGSYAPNSAVVPGTTEAPQGFRIENVDPSEPVDPRFRRQTVDYVSTQPAGTIVIDTGNTYLYYILGGGKAIRYGIGVGRDGFTWAGTEKITRKAEWADWRPPTEMIERQPYLPRFMAGGPGNPLGARTLYLGGTIYRIHGTNEPQTIGKFVSSGCFRMLNADVEDLFERVKVGTKVVILPKSSNAGPQANAAAGKPAQTTAR